MIKSEFDSRLISKKGNLRQLLLLNFYQPEINFLCVKIYFRIVSWEFVSYIDTTIITHCFNVLESLWFFSLIIYNSRVCIIGIEVFNKVNFISIIFFIFLQEMLRLSNMSQKRIILTHMLDWESSGCVTILLITWL